MRPRRAWTFRASLRSAGQRRPELLQVVTPSPARATGFSLCHAEGHDQPLLLGSAQAPCRSCRGSAASGRSTRVLGRIRGVRLPRARAVHALPYPEMYSAPGSAMRSSALARGEASMLAGGGLKVDIVVVMPVSGSGTVRRVRRGSVSGGPGDLGLAIGASSRRPGAADRVRADGRLRPTGRPVARGSLVQKPGLSPCGAVRVAPRAGTCPAAVRRAVIRMSVRRDEPRPPSGPPAGPRAGGAARSRQPQQHHRAHRSGHGGRLPGGSAASARITAHRDARSSNSPGARILPRSRARGSPAWLTRRHAGITRTRASPHPGRCQDRPPDGTARRSRLPGQAPGRHRAEIRHTAHHDAAVPPPALRGRCPFPPAPPSFIPNDPGACPGPRGAASCTTSPDAPITYLMIMCPKGVISRLVRK